MRKTTKYKIQMTNKKQSTNNKSQISNVVIWYLEFQPEIKYG